MGTAASGTEALERIADLRPDVVLLDVLLPDLDGFCVAERSACSTEPPVIVLISSRSRVELAAQLADARIRGFLSKDELTLSNLGALLR